MTTASELANKFEVSTRTIYRDIEDLSAMGIPIYMTKGKGGGISLLPNFILDKTVLTEEEKTEILSSLQAIKEVNLSDKNELFQKFSSLFGDNYVDWIEVDFSSWYNYNNQEECFNELKRAIFKRKAIEISYSNSNGESKKRIIEPVKLYFKGRAWYVYAYCRKRSDYRFFKLSRIKDLVLLTEDVSSHMTNDTPAFEINQNLYKEKLVHIKLHMAKEMAYRVYEEFDSFSEQADGSFIVEIDFPDNEWLFYYISTLGAKCKILEPKELVDRYKKYLEEILNLYK